MLPATIDEVKNKFKNNLDILLLSGDAYIDHPAFGISIIGNILENQGYKVAIVSQPTKYLLKQFPKPNLFIGISAGNVDSIISNYTSNRKVRNTDKYSQDNNPFREDESKKRPDRATIIYSNWVKEIFKNIPVVIGGIEASLRRIIHYDYFSDKLRKSILADSKADILVFGMGELQIVEIAKRISKKGIYFDKKNIPGTCYLSSSPEGIEIPCWDEITQSKSNFLIAYLQFSKNQFPYYGKILSQKQDTRYIICNPPSIPLSSDELDNVYRLPFTRKPHPLFNSVPAYKMIINSINSHRGCIGSCSFCSISLHQGKIVISRSTESILEELDIITSLNTFFGHITDVGGPSADMYGIKCGKYPYKNCGHIKECLHPDFCQNLSYDPEKYFKLLEEIISHPKVKKLSIGSGLRLDLSLSQDKYLQKVLNNYSSGILKIAPEHIAKNVLDLMKKYSQKSIFDFFKRYKKIKKTFNNRVELVPYLILSHPGEEQVDIEFLKKFLKQNKLYNKSIQTFTPSPLTYSTAMYYSGKNPDTNNKVKVIKKQKIKDIRKKIILNSRIS